MAERPILFSAALVRAILAGRKTETRRLVTKGTSHSINFWSSQIDGDGDGAGGPGGAGGFADLDWAAHEISTDGLRPRKDQPHTDRCKDRDYCCIFVDGDQAGPGGFGCGEYLHVPGVGGETRQRVHAHIQPGDVLWVRESWSARASLDETKPSEITDGDPIRYTADGAHIGGAVEAWGKGRPSIFMPRWASRISLRVTEVCAERLKEIDWKGARAEGIGIGNEGFRHHPALVDQFQLLWDEINGKREGAAWADSPWVWVYKFEVVSH